MIFCFHPYGIEEDEAIPDFDSSLLGLLLSAVEFSGQSLFLLSTMQSLSPTCNSPLRCVSTKLIFGSLFIVTSCHQRQHYTTFQLGFSKIGKEQSPALN